MSEEKHSLKDCNLPYFMCEDDSSWIRDVNQNLMRVVRVTLEKLEHVERF